MTKLSIELVNKPDARVQPIQRQVCSERGVIDLESAAWTDAAVRIVGPIGRFSCRLSDELRNDRVIARPEKTCEVARTLMRRRTRALYPRQMQRARNPAVSPPRLIL